MDSLLLAIRSFASPTGLSFSYSLALNTVLRQMPCPIGTEHAPQHDDELAGQILSNQFNPLGIGNVPGYAQFLEA